MGRKGNWFSSIKKAFSPESKEKKAQKSNKSKKKWFGKEKSSVPDSSPSETLTVPHPLPPPEDVKLIEAEDEQTKHAYSVAVATAVAAEAAVAAAQAAAEVVRLTTVNQFTGKPKEEVAAIKIQTAFRGYLARRALRALRGLVRLKSLIQGPTVKRQTANALRCIQTVARVQSQIQSRRIRMSEENQALQRQLLQKRAKELTSSQQNWKKCTKPTSLMFMDPNNPQWGWSWLERWMAARSWEPRTTTGKELNNDKSSIKSASLNTTGVEITKAYTRHLLNSGKPSPTSSQKPSRPSTPPSKAASSTVSRKIKPASPRGSMFSPDDDAKSVFSVQSERNRRHSIAGSSVRDDESLAGSPSVPSYMASTKSAKAKSRMQSPLGLENETLEKEYSAGSVKKRLSFPASPARPRRHSGPPRVEVGSIAG
ncbi:hypothetical protein CsSME_00038445 [Camellia sinensis var. sinensis]